MKDVSEPKRNSPLSCDELSALCWQLSLLCRAGVPWSDSPAILLEDAQTPRVRSLLERLRGPMSQGLPLADALGEAGDLPPYLLRMVSIGQAAGRLDQVLSSLADYYRREAETQSAVRRAVTYPAVMAALIALVFLVLVVRVLPVFSRVFVQLGADLSPVAAALLGFSDWGNYFAGALAALLLIGAAALLLLFRGGAGFSLFTRGATAEAVARGRFASAMSLMLQSGLPMDEALDRTAELLERSPLAERFALCRARMAEGASFPKAVEDSGLLTGLQAGLLAAGFRAGASQEAMDELSQRCQTEADERLTRLLSRFEYALVVVLCLSVGVVLLSVMAPLLGVLSAIGG